MKTGSMGSERVKGARSVKISWQPSVAYEIDVRVARRAFLAESAYSFMAKSVFGSFKSSSLIHVLR